MDHSLVRLEPMYSNRCKRLTSRNATRFHCIVRNQPGGAKAMQYSYGQRFDVFCFTNIRITAFVFNHGVFKASVNKFYFASAFTTNTAFSNGQCVNTKKKDYVSFISRLIFHVLQEYFFFINFKFRTVRPHKTLVPRF